MLYKHFSVNTMEYADRGEDSRKYFLRKRNMDTKNLVAIDVHTHATVSIRQLEDPAKKAMQDAVVAYFKEEGPRPTIPEVAAYYRERKMACVIFPVDSE